MDQFADIAALYPFFMQLLTTKLQYKDFETGEFTEERKRTYEETIVAIEAFPWEKQRDKIQIDLTNPSVTMQNDEDEFLKFALFFNGKFVLHFFSADQKLYTKSFISTKEAYPYISKFFEPGEYDLADFKTENTWLQHNLKHFVSQDFHYEVTPRSARRYLLKTSGASLALTVFVLVMLIGLGFKEVRNLPWPLWMFLIPFTFVLGGGLNLILFFNYYSFARNKVLILSQGNDIFYLGNKEDPTRYDKKNIRLATTYQYTNGKNPVYGFAVMKIEFKDDTIIHVPNIFVSELALQSKLWGFQKQNKESFPYIKRTIANT